MAFGAGIFRDGDVVNGWTPGRASASGLVSADDLAAIDLLAVEVKACFGTDPAARFGEDYSSTTASAPTTPRSRDLR